MNADTLDSAKHQIKRKTNTGAAIVKNRRGPFPLFVVENGQFKIDAAMLGAASSFISDA